MSIDQNISSTAKVFFEQSGLDLRLSDVDPHLELVARGEWQSQSNDADYFIGPSLRRLMKAWDQKFLSFARTLNASEAKYSKSLPLKAIEKTGFTTHYPGFVKNIEKSELGLAPTICCHTFHSLQGSCIEKPFFITTCGPCYRQEVQSPVNLLRLNAFTMREIVCIGPEPVVKNFREQTTNFLKELMQEVGFKAQIVAANDPFFTTEKKQFQQLLDLKRELQIFLPYLNQWLAIASLNWHMHSQVQAFSLSGPGPEVLHSACVGFGLERWSLALYAQFGLDEPYWPQAVKKMLLQAETGE